MARSENSPAADNPVVRVLRLASEGWLADPSCPGVSPNDVRAFASRREAAEYALDLGEQLSAAVVIMPSAVALNS